jgi:hypothetical protein
MKLSEGIKLKGVGSEIPSCSRDDLPDFFKEMGFKVGVEVGVFKGEYTEVLAKSGLKIYGVDPWRQYGGYDSNRGQPWLDELYNTAKTRLDRYKNVSLIRKTSMEAVESFAENSIDFVYIDGNHQFRYIAEDIVEWGIRVKPGGIICGHDYALFKHRFPRGGCQVKEVVDAYVRSYDIKDFWILGKKDDKDRDHFRSWMMFRKNYDKDKRGLASKMFTSSSGGLGARV